MSNGDNPPTNGQGEALRMHAGGKTLSLARLYEDHEALADAVHSMRGRLDILESRVLLAEKIIRILGSNSSDIK